MMVRLVDDNGYPWLWNEYAQHLDLDWEKLGEKPEHGSGHRVTNVHELITTLLSGGWFETIASILVQLPPKYRKQLEN